MEPALWAQFPRRTTLIWMLAHSCAIEQFARARFEHFDRRSPGHATPRESDRRFRDRGILTQERRAVKSGARSRCRAPHQQGTKPKGFKPKASNQRLQTKGFKPKASNSDAPQSHEHVEPISACTWTATQNRFKHPRNACGKFRRRCVVSNDVGCTLPLLGERELGGLAAGELFRRPAAGARNALLPHCRWCVYKHDGVALAVEAYFEKERRIDDEGNLRLRRRRKLCAAKCLNARMHDALDALACVGRREDGAREKRTIDRSIRRKQRRSARRRQHHRRDLRDDLGFRQHAAREIVAVANLAAKRCKRPRDFALTTANTTDDADGGAKWISVRSHMRQDTNSLRALLSSLPRARKPRHTHSSNKSARQSSNSSSSTRSMRRLRSRRNARAASSIRAEASSRARRSASSIEATKALPPSWPRTRAISTSRSAQSRSSPSAETSRFERVRSRATSLGTVSPNGCSAKARNDASFRLSCRRTRSFAARASRNVAAA